MIEPFLLPEPIATHAKQHARLPTRPFFKSLQHPFELAID
jgi:hypothetical protein